MLDPCRTVRRVLELPGVLAQLIADILIEGAALYSDAMHAESEERLRAAYGIPAVTDLELTS